MLRLFIAVEFCESVKQELSALGSRLKALSCGGNFTARDNLHLTLVFLGEVAPARVPAVLEAMGDAAGEPFSLSLSGLDKFCRRDGDLYFLAVTPHAALTQLHDTLTAKLAETQIPYDTKAFFPHITLARRCKMASHFSQSDFAAFAKPVTVLVNHITLMQSQRKNGKLLYTPLAKIPLLDENRME